MQTTSQLANEVKHACLLLTAATLPHMNLGAGLSFVPLPAVVLTVVMMLWQQAQQGHQERWQQKEYV